MLLCSMIAANPTSISKSVPVPGLCALCVSVFSSPNLSPFNLELLALGVVEGSTLTSFFPKSSRIRTYAKLTRNPFRICTYKKPGEGVARISICAPFTPSHRSEAARLCATRRNARNPLPLMHLLHNSRTPRGWGYRGLGTQAQQSCRSVPTESYRRRYIVTSLLLSSERRLESTIAPTTTRNH